jgi:hypothetical protein
LEIGSVPLAGCTVDENAREESTRDLAFAVRGQGRLLVVACDTDTERRAWINLISETCKNASIASPVTSLSIEKVGELWRLGKRFKWRRRRLWLRDGALRVSSSKMTDTKKHISLHGAEVKTEEQEVHGRVLAFTVKYIDNLGGQKSISFSCETSPTLCAWTQAIEAAIFEAKSAPCNTTAFTLDTCQ